MEFRRDELEKFAVVFGEPKFWDEDTGDENIVCAIGYEVNYGLYDDREELARLDLTFDGCHGAGDNYGDIAFACYKGEDVEINADRDGTPVATVLPDGSVPPNEKENAIKFWDIYKQAKEYIEGATT